MKHGLLRQMHHTPYKSPVWRSQRRVTALVLVASLFSLLFGPTFEILLRVNAKYFVASAICFYQEGATGVAIIALLLGGT